MTASAPVPIEEAVGRLTDAPDCGTYRFADGKADFVGEQRVVSDADIRLVLSTLAAQSGLLRDIRTGLEPFGWVLAADGSQSISTNIPGGEILERLGDLLARINALHPEKEIRS